VFQGYYVNSINDKGRLSIPSEFREALRETLREGETETLWITKDLDRCLVAYPPDEWDRVKQKAARLSDVRRADIAYKRHILHAAHKCQIDAQGRILIPVGLREYAGLKKKCKITGVSNHIEIWDADIYDQYMSEALNDPEDMRKHLAEQGF
jgi:MraZ protein